MLRFLDAGESHGKCLLGIIEGMPAGLFLDEDKINENLQRRQMGYGRGKRMEIENDHVEILSGVISRKTIGTPIGLMIKNNDWENVRKQSLSPLSIPRPGHADLAGITKYGLDDCRPVLERASARQTAMKVAIGSIARQFLEYFKINSYNHVTRIGSISVKDEPVFDEELKSKIQQSKVFCMDELVSEKMCREIDEAGKNGDTLGGVFEVAIKDAPVGLGSYAHWDRRLDGRLAAALMSIPGVKAVEIGKGIEISKKSGSKVHDEIFIAENKQKTHFKYYRKKNNAGGLEGGISNGEVILLRAYFKPIPTLLSPLDSVNIKTGRKTKAMYQRSDICVVPAASVVGEAMVDWEIAAAFLEKFGGDSLQETENNFLYYQKGLEK
ncbi:MAG: chorismate synthase [Candidatus Caldatribacteriota bacterium]|nr:chorismate synthase [Candidatus Caldatribacteriota bacterium]